MLNALISSPELYLTLTAGSRRITQIVRQLNAKTWMVKSQWSDFSVDFDSREVALDASWVNCLPALERLPDTAFRSYECMVLCVY